MLGIISSLSVQTIDGDPGLWRWVPWAESGRGRESKEVAVDWQWNWGRISLLHEFFPGGTTPFLCGSLTFQTLFSIALSLFYRQPCRQRQMLGTCSHPVESEACSSNGSTGVTDSVLLSPVLPLLIWVPCVIGCVMWPWAECADSSIWGPSGEQKQRFSEFSKTIIIVFSFQNSVLHKYLGQSLTLTVVILFLCVKLHWYFAQLNILTLKALQCFISEHNLPEMSNNGTMNHCNYI